MKKFTCLFAATALICAIGFIGVPQNCGAQTESLLYTFNGTDGHFPDGAYPWAGLILDKKGNLYGTSVEGGAFGAGAVFELSPPYSQGSETVLYSFTGGADGYTPFAGLILDKKGNLYGTTYEGGTRNSSFPDGAGVVFKLSPPYGQSHETVLCSFTGGADGAYPWAGLILDKKGNLYGTTTQGGVSGSNSMGGTGYGVVFKLDKKGNETVLYTFSGGADGSTPYSGVILGKKGSLYGTAEYGGMTQNGGYGVVFKLDKKGNETVLYTFGDGTDGGYPAAGVIMDKKGNLYGTTYEGGASGGGVVFGIVP